MRIAFVVTFDLDAAHSAEAPPDIAERMRQILHEQVRKLTNPRDGVSVRHHPLSAAELAQTP